MEPQGTGIKTWQWVVTVIVIIVLIILGYNMFKGGSTTPSTDDVTTDGTTPGSTSANRIIVSDQFPGNIVYVTSVQFAQPGFVEIHKDNAGQPGAIIGSQYFDKGTNTGKITLTEATVDGGIYYAVLYTDNGDKKFNAAQDLPLKDSAGNTIMKIFRATLNPTEVKG